MNRIKEKQEPPVKTYKDLKLSSIPDNMNEIYEPVIYKREAPMLEQFYVGGNIGGNISGNVEGFGLKNRQNKVLILILFALIGYLIYLNK